MTTVSAFEAKTHLSQLLDRVANGEEILITRRGQPVALLRSPEVQEPDIEEVIRKMRELRKGNILGDDTSIRELIEEGRA